MKGMLLAKAKTWKKILTSIKDTFAQELSVRGGEKSVIKRKKIKQNSNLGGGEDKGKLTS